MKATINSRKHIVQRTQLVIEEQTSGSWSLVKPVVDQPNVPTEVVIGAGVKAIWIEYWLLGESSQPCFATWIGEKLPASAVAATQAEMQALDTYGNKNNILKMGQGIIGDSNSNPIPIMREWLAIPKGKQRFAIGDELRFNISCIGAADNGLEVCGFALFKEYY